MIDLNLLEVGRKLAFNLGAKKMNGVMIQSIMCGATA